MNKGQTIFSGGCMNPPTLHQEFLNTVAAIPPSPEEAVPDRSPRNSLAGLGTLAKRLRDQLKAADMSELSFAKTFLTTLDAKTTRYSADHVFDPKTFETRIPVCVPQPLCMPSSLPVSPTNVSFCLAVHAPKTSFSTTPFTPKNVLSTRCARLHLCRSHSHYSPKIYA